jgi:hypothetical protein
MEALGLSVLPGIPIYGLSTTFATVYDGIADEPSGNISESVALVGFWFLGALFITAALAVMLTFLYIGTAHLINKTYVSVHSGQVEVKYGPLPWPGVFRGIGAQFERFECEKSSISGSPGGLKEAYMLMGKKRGGGQIEHLSLGFLTMSAFQPLPNALIN